jgi:ABC-type multidrug transport system ATPase subunit
LFDVEFHDLGLVLDGIEIVKGISGTLKSGRTCAIMGPSGAGKTTFVTLLTGKVQRTSGVVFLNGKPDELSRYSKLIGYVPQEDVMIRELTVREILIILLVCVFPRVGVIIV